MNTKVVNCLQYKINQRTNGPVNAHLIYGPRRKHKKPKPNSILPLNRSRSTKGYHLYKLCRLENLVARSSDWFLRKEEKVLKIYGCGSTSWSCDLDHLYKLLFPLPMKASHGIWL